MLALMAGVFFVLKKQYDRQQLQERDSFFFVNYRGFQLRVAKFRLLTRAGFHSADRPTFLKLIIWSALCITVMNLTNKHI